MESQEDNPIYKFLLEIFGGGGSVAFLLYMISKNYKKIQSFFIKVFDFFIQARLAKELAERASLENIVEEYKTKLEDITAKFEAEKRDFEEEREAWKLERKEMSDLIQEQSKMISDLRVELERERTINEMSKKK